MFALQFISCVVIEVKLVTFSCVLHFVTDITFKPKLFARFEGRDVETQQGKDDSKDGVDETAGSAAEGDESSTEIKLQPVREVAQGTWTTVSKDDNAAAAAQPVKSKVKENQSVDDSGEADAQTSSDGIHDDADVEPVDEEADGEPLEEGEDADGEALDEESADGEPLEDGEDADGEPMDNEEDVGGEPL